MNDIDLSQHYKAMILKWPVLFLYWTLVVIGLVVIGLYLLSIGYLPTKIEPMEFIVLGFGASAMAAAIFVTVAVILFAPGFIKMLITVSGWYQSRIGPSTDKNAKSAHSFFFVLSAFYIPFSILLMKEGFSIWSLGIPLIVMMLGFALAYWRLKIPLVLVLVDTLVLALMSGYAVMMVNFGASYMEGTNVYKLLVLLYMCFFSALAVFPHYTPKILFGSFFTSMLVAEIAIGWATVHMSIIGGFSVSKLGIGNYVRSGLFLSGEGCQVLKMEPNIASQLEENGELCRTGMVRVVWGIGEETVLEFKDGNVLYKVVIPSNYILGEEHRTVKESSSKE